MKKGKKKVKYAPVFRPCEIEVIGIKEDKTYIRLPIANHQDCGGQNPQGDNILMRIFVYL